MEMIALFLIIVFLSSLLVWVVFRYEYLLKEKEAENIATNEAKKILDKLYRKGQEIVDTMEHANKTMKSQFEREISNVSQFESEIFENASRDLLSMYKKKLTGLNEHYVKTLNRSVAQIEQEALSEVRDFRLVLAKETVDLQKIVEGKIEEEYAILEKELEDYKVKKLAKIDEEILDLLHNVSKLAFGKNATLEQKKELVFDALRQAKAEGVFGG